MSADNVLKTIKDEAIKFVDFRFTDTRGKEQHVSVPSHQVDADTFESGKMFDGSSIAGWKGINESDMVLMPDACTAVIDPFFDEPTMILRCDVLEPITGQGYGRDPRSSRDAPRPISSPPGSGTSRTSARSPSSSFSTTFAGARTWPGRSARSTPKKPGGTLKRYSPMVISAIAPA